MGRQAQCECTWNGATSVVTALIEPPDLLLRGGLRMKIPIRTLRQVRADGPVPRFAGDEGSFALGLGTAAAARWARALLEPPPSLAKKLGITPKTVVRMMGPLDDPALEAALGEAEGTAAVNPELVVARVDAPADLARALLEAAPHLAQGAALWLVYPKGPGRPLGEGAVRTAARARGMVDTKVAAVSHRLTALRFVRRPRS